MKPYNLTYELSRKITVKRFLDQLVDVSNSSIILFAPCIVTFVLINLHSIATFATINIGTETSTTQDQIQFYLHILFHHHKNTKDNSDRRVYYFASHQQQEHPLL